MKTKIFGHSGILLFSCLLWIGVSCDSLRDTYSDFTQGGERVYVGKVDSLRIFSGYERVRIWGLMHFARTADEVVVEWNNQQQIHSLEGFGKNDTLKLDIGGLTEGSTRFRIYTRDKELNLSVTEDIFAEIYGPMFLKTQSPRSIGNISINGDTGIDIDWNDPEYNVVGVELKYLDEEGRERTLRVGNLTKKSVLTSWKSGSDIRTVTRILPNQTDIDTLSLPAVTYTLPRLSGELPVNGSRFTRLKDPFAAGEDAYGGMTGGLFDGNEGSLIHTHDGVGVPNHISYDMGKGMNLSKGRLVVRYNEPGDGWTPTRAELWGLDGYLDAPGAGFETEKLPGIPDNVNNKVLWPEQARAKGWVKLADITYDPATNRGVVEFSIDKSRKVRHLIYRPVRVADPQGEGPGVYSCAKELYLWQFVE